MNISEHIIIIGTGKVAQQLSNQLAKLGIPLAVIWGRNFEKAKEIADKLQIQAFKEIPKEEKEALFLICVSDGAIVSVVGQLTRENKIAYTSGSVQLKDLPTYPNLGVFYPLQSFSENRTIDFSEIPFLIEANSSEFEAELVALAQKISGNVRITTSEERFLIHIAAVMVNNFTNYLFLLAEKHLKEHQLNLDILKPLMKETVDKLRVLSPHEAQTGPAVRGDMNIINKHIQTLTNTDSKKIYELFSNLIEKEFKNEKL